MNPQEFITRREQFMQQMAANSIAIFVAGQPSYRNGDADYPFRQDSDFYYLTGFNEAQSVLVLAPDCEVKVQFFCLPKAPQAEIWHGKRMGPDVAVSVLGVDASESTTVLDERLPQLIAGHEQVYFHQGKNAEADQWFSQWMQQVQREQKKDRLLPSKLIDPSVILHEMRLFKSETELMLMRKATTISIAAQQELMRQVKPGLMEYQLEAILKQQFTWNGARDCAYNSIVAGGDNACILHYTENNALLAAGDLVLVDAGCEYQNYASDLTRTFPVNGQYSAEQKALYDIVLASQLAALEYYQPGKTLPEAYQACVEVIAQGLIDLKILQKPLTEVLERKLYQPFFMHGLGHWLGLDVHDVGDYRQKKNDRQLEPGMVLTVEPGLYITDLLTDEAIDPRWLGIGIRIEDDIVITKEGHENLSQDLIKTTADIEYFMANAKH